MIHCPKCGYAMQLVNAGQSFGRPWAVCHCDFCQHTARVGRQPPPTDNQVVVEKLVECPHCNSTRNKVENTRVVGQVRVRYRRCEDCGRRFKSTVATPAS